MIIQVIMQGIIFLARLILLVGQIVDGFATISIGYLSDKTNTRFG